MRWLAVSVVALTVFCDVLAEFPPSCDMPMDPGLGDEVIVLLYYSKAEDKCHPFRYGGQGGNENRFYTDRMCMQNCSSGAGDLYPDEKEACRLPNHHGHCLSRYLLWYYDSIHGKCKSFFYTGCGGNGNRFVSKDLCNTTCAGIIGEGDMEEEVESDTPAGLIIGIVLGVLGAVIMIFTVVMVVKNKKPKTKETKKVQKEDDSPLQPEGMEMA